MTACIYISNYVELFIPANHCTQAIYTHICWSCGRADLMDNDQIEGLMKYQPPWSQELERWRAQHSNTLDGGASIK